MKPEQEILDYLASRLSPDRRASFEQALADPTSAISLAVESTQQAARRRKWLKGSPIVELELGLFKPVEQQLLKPVTPAATPSSVRQRMSRQGQLLVAALLLLAFAGVIGYTIQTANAADQKDKNRQVEEGKKDGEAASKMKLESARLKIEIRRRLQMALTLIESKPIAGNDGEVLTRGTYFYNLLCIHGTDPDPKRKGQLDHLFVTFTEYQKLTTCQLAVQLVMSTDYPKPSGKDDLIAWRSDRETAITVMNALDGLIAKHVNFHDAAGAKAFEEDIRKQYPSLIDKLKPLD